MQRITNRRRIQIILLGTLAAWWALWDFETQAAFVPKLALRIRWIDPALLKPFLFFGLPIGTVAVAQLICYSLDRTFIGRGWTVRDLLRLAFWRTVSPTIALLFVATGFDEMYDRRLIGILWLLFAAILAMVATLRLRSAEGMKMQRVKSGELYKRAFAMAKDMGTPLKRVYVVPAGRGHLTNAYGLSESIAVTDNYGKFLNRAQLDFVIGHELGHVKEKHGRKKLLIVTIVFAAFALMCFFLPSSLISFRPVLDIFVMLVPILGFDYVKDFLQRRPPAVGLTFGIDSGDLVKLEMNEQPEYIGRAINVAARLQDHAKKVEPAEAYQAVFSKHSFNGMASPHNHGFHVKTVTASLRNIAGGDIECIAYSPL
jgi:Zn-dependent protease with chaperone function